MENTIKNQVAGTIAGQIRAGIGDAAMMSWGITAYRAVEYKGMPALRLTVDARLFKGDVIIALDEGADTYEIHLEGSDGGRLLRGDVYCDELGDIIDKAIEVGDDWSEYEAFCEVERFKFIQDYGFDPKGKDLTIIC